jgi:hypothetical protein
MCATEKVEEYYDVYKEEFNALLTLIQEKLQQQKQSMNAAANKRGVSADIVSDRLSIMVCTSSTYLKMNSLNTPSWLLGAIIITT